MYQGQIQGCQFMGRRERGGGGGVREHSTPEMLENVGRGRGLQPPQPLPPASITASKYGRSQIGPETKLEHRSSRLDRKSVV